MPLTTLARALVPLGLLLASLGVAVASGFDTVGLSAAAVAVGVVASVAALIMAEDLRSAASHLVGIALRPWLNVRVVRRFAANR